jgi:hypothetical protein
MTPTGSRGTDVEATLAVESWLNRIVPLFGAWPPDHPDADDTL